MYMAGLMPGWHMGTNSVVLVGCALVETGGDPECLRGAGQALCAPSHVRVGPAHLGRY